MDLRKTPTYASLLILYTFLATLLMVYHSTQHYQNVDSSLFGNFFTFGNMGEDMLLATMGFTVFYTSSKYIERQSGYKEFMAKTLLRIYLTYWLIIAIPGALVWFIRPDIHASIALIEGDKLWQTMTMWFGHPRIAVITWILTHLVFFVFIFGLAILNKKFKYLWYFILILSAINAIDKAFVGSQLFGAGNSMMYLIFSPHNLEFAFGAWAYYLFEKGYKIERYNLFLIFAIIVFISVGTLYSQAGAGFDYHSHRVFAFGLTALLLVVAVVNHGKFIAAPQNNIFYKLGEAEYIMLLFHGPILSIVDYNFAVKASYGWAVSLATIFLILVLSYLIRTRMEEPLLTFVNRRLLGKK